MDLDELTKLNMNTSMCAPNLTDSKYFNIEEHHTCFTKHELLSIVNAFNDYIINKSLCDKSINGNIICIPVGNLITVNFNDSIKEIWFKIYDKFKDFCNYESCWVNLTFINEIHDKKLINKLRYFTFKPKFYNNRNKWLNTQDIDYIMQQYQKLYDDFLYIGTEPCDFYTIKNVNYNAICNTNKVGVIFNLDTSKQIGSHWTSLFIDNTNRHLYYFDSTGKNPNKYIDKFIKNYPKEYIKHYNKKDITQYKSDKLVFTIYINKKVHQKGTSECGVYSIYFLIKKIKTDDPINNKRITDKSMKNFRKYIFNYN